MHSDSVLIKFDENGQPSLSTTVLDLRKGKFVKLTGGMYKNNYDLVLGKNEIGHYRILFAHPRKETKSDKSHDTKIRLLGNWWLQAGVEGHGVVEGGLFPLVNVDKKKVPDEIMDLLKA